MKLVVVSNLEHYRSGPGFVGAWPAAVREIDALASLFDDVTHVACLHAGDAPAQAQPYRAANVRLTLAPPAGGPGLHGKLGALRALPGRVAAIQRAWRDADAALVRCPSSSAAAALGLISLGLGPARAWVKYAGAWRGRENEKLAHRMQRLWLRTGLSGAAVTVGGTDESPGGGAAALCNPSLSLAEARAAERATRHKALARPWRLLSVGRLVEAKGVDVAIRALALLTRDGHPVELDIAGDGPERNALERLAAALGLSDKVRFHGWLGDEGLDGLYRQCHALLAPSRGEGWARAWTDAAARRCVPVASDVGGARGLERAAAGIVIPSYSPAVWAVRVEALLSNEAAWRLLAEQGPILATAFTYERFLEGARAIFELDGSPRERQLFEVA